MMTTANQSPAERLQAALEEYWPDGCKMFIRNADGACKGDWVAHGDREVAIGSHTFNNELLCVATIAAVAASWWRKKKQDCKFGSVQWGYCLAAAVQFDKIFEAATEAEQ